MIPNFHKRIHAEEMMDDFSITDARLTEALHNLRVSNRWLGGYSAITTALAPLLAGKARTLRLLDVGTGLADVPVHLIRWAASRGSSWEVVGLDANPATVQTARHYVDRALPGALRKQVRVQVGDALALDAADGAFDVVLAAQFLHHFDAPEAVTLLREMQRVAKLGVLVSDLHRHPLAYYGLKLLVNIAPVSPMYRHDGPISVLRGFRRDELVSYAKQAHLPHPEIRWHWAFRWTLSTLARSNNA